MGHNKFGTFFKMAAKRLALEQKTIRTSFEEATFTYTTRQSKRKSDKWKLSIFLFKVAYSGIWVFFQDGGQFSGYAVIYKMQTSQTWHRMARPTEKYMCRKIS